MIIKVSIDEIYDGIWALLIWGFEMTRCKMMSFQTIISQVFFFEQNL